MSILKKTATVVLLFAAGALAHAAPSVLHLRADSWMPFNGDPAGEKPGYVVEFLREIFEPLGVKIDYQVMPWADALKSAEGGEIDGVLCANASEAEHLLLGTEPVAEPQFSLFVRKDSPWKYQNLRSLQGVQLGAVEGYKYWDSIDGYIKKSTPPAVHFYSGDSPAALAAADLAAGKVDVVVESVLVFYWTLKGNGQKISDFRTAYTEKSDPLFVAFHKNKRGLEYSKMLDEGLRRLKSNGRFDSILEKYGFAKN